MRRLSILILCLISLSANAQRVKVLSLNNNYEKYRDSQYFDYVHEDFDTSKLVWVADIRVEFDTVIRGMIGESFKLMKEKSNNWGANAFTVKESDIYSLGREKYIEMSIYWLRMEDRATNLQLHRTKKIYLLGYLAYHREIEGYDVQIQEEDITMRALTYREYSYPVKTDVSIQLGSKVRGATTYCRIEEKMYPKFYYFNMLKGSFKNAYIDEYKLSFGLFLINILKKD